MRIGGMELAVVSPESGGFPRHSHDEYVLSANVVGRERVRLDRAAFEVGTEELTLYNPGQVQSCRAETRDGARWSCVSLYVAPSAVAELTGGDAPEFDRPAVRAPRLRAELLQAITVHNEPELLAERFSALVLECFDLGRGRREREPVADPRVDAVRERLRGDLSTPPRIGELAEAAGLSREGLIRAFTRATGSPPYAWHLQARLAEGRRLLRRGLGVAEVAHALGFADQAHFHKHFRAAYAVTPGRYRAGAVNI